MNENKKNVNLMILSKREETEKHITNEYIKLKRKLDLIRKSAQNDTAESEILQGECASLNYQSAFMSGKLSYISYENKRKQKDLVVMECKIDELKARQNQAQNVLDKERLTINLLLNNMELHTNKVNEFWKQNNNYEIKHLKEKKALLEAKKQKLLDETEHLKIKTADKRKAMQKLEEEIMILKKRNAAYLRRMQKKLTHLEELLSIKKRTYSTSFISN